MIFEEQVKRKPDHYPWTEDFIRAIWEGFWTDAEFSFASDKQDFYTKLTDQEKEIIVRALSAIGQIEIAVKTFWVKLGDNLPHPSIRDLGIVMGNSEVVHNNAYERLLEELGLTSRFEENLELEWIQGRVNYLKKYTKKFHSDNKKQFVYSLILFTLFVENISLFSQFYVINWFGRRNFLKDTNQQTSYTLKEECYIDGTEIMTPDGWRQLKDMEIGDVVYQYNEDGSIEECFVLKTHANQHNGKIISFEGYSHLCKVTPNHDMVYYNPNGDYIRKRAEDIKINKNFLPPCGGVLKNYGDTQLSFEERLRVAIQVDDSRSYWANKSGETPRRGVGGGYDYAISIKAEEKKQRLRWILKNVGVTYSEYDIPNREGFTKFSISYDSGSDCKKFGWINLIEKTSEWCVDFCQELKHWSGSLSDSENIIYTSSDKECVDKCQLIAVLGGYKTHINEQQHNEENHNTDYSLTIRENEPIASGHAIKKTSEHYDGMVYCVTVSSGAIITRYNNKTFIAGNCLHANIGTKLINTIKEEYPELFDEELEKRIYSESLEAFKAESKIVEWMIDGIQDEKLNEPLLKEFIKNRINESLVGIGYNKVFEVDSELLKNTHWFDEQNLGNGMTDFFHSRPVEYSKHNQSFDPDSIF